MIRILGGIDIPEEFIYEVMSDDSVCSFMYDDDVSNTIKVAKVIVEWIPAVR